MHAYQRVKNVNFSEKVLCLLSSWQLQLTHYISVLRFYTSWKHQKTFRFSDVFRDCRKATPSYYRLSNICRTRYGPVRAVSKAIFVPVDRYGAQINKLKKQIKFWKLTCLLLKKKHYDNFQVFLFDYPRIFSFSRHFHFSPLFSSLD